MCRFHGRDKSRSRSCGASGKVVGCGATDGAWVAAARGRCCRGRVASPGSGGATAARVDEPARKAQQEEGGTRMVGPTCSGERHRATVEAVAAGAWAEYTGGGQLVWRLWHQHVESARGVVAVPAAMRADGHEGGGVRARPK